MPEPILVFDLDGTLIDTAPDLLDSLNHCLALADMAPVAESELRRYVGMGGKVMIERAFAARNRELTQSHLADLLNAFLQHYTDNMPGRSKPFTGVVSALQRFATSGYTLAVCTNKYEGLSQRLLGDLELSKQFKVICGQDTFPYRKPDPRHLLSTIELAGGDPARAIMIGDSETDIRTAQSAGIPVIAVDFGYTDKHVSAYDPSHIISHFDEMTMDLVESLLKAAAL